MDTEASERKPLWSSAASVVENEGSPQSGTEDLHLHRPGQTDVCRYESNEIHRVEKVIRLPRDSPS